MQIKSLQAYGRCLVLCAILWLTHEIRCQSLPSILIKIPTRARPIQFFNQLKKYIEYLSGLVPVKFLITCDEDDESMNNAAIKQRLASYPDLIVEFSHNASKVAAYNAGLTKIIDQCDIIVLASDDTEPVLPGYDTVIANSMVETFPHFDGVLAFHDGHVGGQCATVPIIGKNFYTLFDYAYHPDYQSFFCDEELTITANMLNKFKAFDFVLIQHNHPGWGLGAWDSLYARNEKFYTKDRIMFMKRLAKNFDLIASQPSLHDTLIEQKRHSFKSGHQIKFAGKTNSAAFIDIFIDDEFVKTVNTNDHYAWSFSTNNRYSKGQHHVFVIARYKENKFHVRPWQPNNPNTAFDSAYFLIH